MCKTCCGRIACRAGKKVPSFSGKTSRSKGSGNGILQEVALQLEHSKLRHDYIPLLKRFLRGEDIRFPHAFLNRLSLDLRQKLEIMQDERFKALQQTS
ncbi:MAG: hypothetical protein HQ402_02380 [Parcubacteria group bacterium]|nr:hypothetical protein [Parcubacteria group bacterium]